MEPVRVLREDLILVDWGPTTLTISAWLQGRPRPVMAVQAARLALESLAQLADFQNYLKREARTLPAHASLPPVVERARGAAARVGRGLTPLAAVAGAMADQVADLARDLGADKVLVNNGGDIALRLGPGQSARVGVKQKAARARDLPANLGKLIFPASSGVGGVASSGWSGRSLSQGVADLVTVWSASASLADAAATALGNAVDVHSPRVSRVPAHKKEPASCLGDILVVEKVGSLSREQGLKALEQGRRAARSLYEEGHIKGCLMVVQGQAAWFDPEECHEADPKPWPPRGAEVSAPCPLP